MDYLADIRARFGTVHDHAEIKAVQEAAGLAPHIDGDLTTRTMAETGTGYNEAGFIRRTQSVWGLPGVVGTTR